MGTYIKYENDFKHLVDLVILIKRQEENLSKFSHIKNMKQPIVDDNFIANKTIMNDGNINDTVTNFKQYLKEINFI